MSLDASTSRRVVNHIPAMVAYWNTALRCVFANDAYLVWFGRTPQEMDGMPMQQLLGPLFALNLPYIQGALGGTKQVFERQIKLPGGETRETIATYTPDSVDGQVLGFSVHVADVTLIAPGMEWTVDKNASFSRSRNTPFHGWELKGRAVRTIVAGKTVWAL